MLVAVLATVLAGCTTVVPGTAAPEGAASGTVVPTVPEGPAEWALSALDPCLLLAGAPVAGTPPFPSKPHNCAIDYTGAAGRPTRLVVRVGITYDTGDRARGARTTVAGLTAYQSRDTEGSEYDPAECYVDIPISAIRSIQVMSESLGGDVQQSCAGTRAAAETVAAKLASPAALVRTSPPTALGRWSACVLLEEALGYVAEPGGLNNPHADDCRATPPESRLDAEGPSVQIDMEAGPEALPEPLPGDSIVNLPLGPALQKPLSSLCEITFIAERQPGNPPDYAAQLMRVNQRGSTGDPCADALAAATQIQNTLGSTPAPEPPAAPERLGFADGEPDDVMPAPCGLFNTGPESCRAPRPAQPPATAREVLQLTATDPSAPDVSCAILREAATPVMGPEIELAASGDSGCIALAPDGFSVTLGFFSDAAAVEYCNGLERQDVQIAGRPGTRCGPSPGTYHLILPALGADPQSPGVVLVDGTLEPPRGDREVLGPEDEPRVTDLTSRVTENVISRYLSA